MNLKYMIIGAGATGGCLGGYLSRAGKDVRLIARENTLEKILNRGLKIRHADEEESFCVNAVSEKDICDIVDIIFVCVKYYSLESVYDMIKRASDSHTVIIPLLNVYGTGEKMNRELGLNVINGCIYIAASVDEPGILRMSGDIFRIVFGSISGNTDDPILLQVCKDLEDAGIKAIYSDNIRRDTLQKFAMVSPWAASEAYYDVTAGEMQKDCPARDSYIQCIREIEELAHKMGIRFEVDIIQTGIDILDAIDPDGTASMYRDLKAGRPTEMDGLIFEVVRMAKKYGTEIPEYSKIAAKFGFTGDSD